MDDYDIADDGWTIIKNGKYLVRENRAHVAKVLETKRLTANRDLIAELASYADDVRLVA